MDNISEYINAFNTENENGFTITEIGQVLQANPNIDKYKFWESLSKTTIIEDERLGSIVYKCHVESALRFSLLWTKINFWNG